MGHPCFFFKAHTRAEPGFGRLIPLSVPPRLPCFFLKSGGVARGSRADVAECAFSEGSFSHSTPFGPLVGVHRRYGAVTRFAGVGGGWATFSPSRVWLTRLS